MAARHESTGTRATEKVSEGFTPLAAGDDNAQPRVCHGTSAAAQIRAHRGG